jgi:hypothetical protein
VPKKTNLPPSTSFLPWHNSSFFRSTQGVPQPRTTLKLVRPKMRKKQEISMNKKRMPQNIAQQGSWYSKSYETITKSVTFSRELIDEFSQIIFHEN